MQYAYIRDGKVYELIPEFDPAFPAMPINERYSSEFLQGVLAVQDGIDVQLNMLYTADTGEFSWPEPVPAPEPIEPTPTEPTVEERNRADIDYLALMMGVSL